MSEEKQEVAPIDEGQDVAVDLEAKLKELESQNQRLLSESQKYKVRHEKLQELEGIVKTYQQKEEQILQEEGKITELYKREKERNEELSNLLKSRDNLTLKLNLENSLRRASNEIIDVEDVMGQSLLKDIVEYDEETLKPTDESINTFLNSLKEKKPHLFASKVVKPMADAKPVIEKPVHKPLHQMSKAERAELRAAKLKSLT